MNHLQPTEVDVDAMLPRCAIGHEWIFPTRCFQGTYAVYPFYSANMMCKHCGTWRIDVEPWLQYSRSAYIERSYYHANYVNERSNRERAERNRSMEREAALQYEGETSNDTCQ